MVDDLEDDDDYSGPEEELKEAEFDEEKNEYVLKTSIEDPVVGMAEPVEKKTIIDRIVGFVEPVVENRFIKKTEEQIEQEEEEEKLRKGPLFRYRTSRRDIEIDD